MNSSPLRRHATTFKLLTILLLAGLLQIPLALIDELLAERAARRDQALSEISAAWGREQQITGPFLVVPARAVATTVRDQLASGRLVQTTEQRPAEQLAVFLPEQLAIEGQLEPVRRHRGIYSAVVYSARLRLSGRFAAPDLAALGLEVSALDWDRAWLALGVDDLRGARETIVVDWNDAPLPAAPRARHPLLANGLHAALPPLAPGAAPGDFSLELTLNGAGRLAFVPAGRQTEVALRSTWADPSFTGALLPERRELGPDGFEASWRSAYYGREFAPQWLGESAAPSRDTLSRAAFGVELIDLVDGYRVVERATKYGILFFALVFAAFFLFEVLATLRLHVVHYGLVGAALVLFYLALLSLSEFAPFGVAYLAAALASSLLITLYAASILRRGARALVIGGALAAIYGFLFFVLRMQDYSLLAGTAALFAALAFVMFATRKLDWSAPVGAPAAPPPLPED